ncbi:MAG: TolC family protein [Synechococcus sp. cluster3_bin.96]|nr:TolC family protein [Synechococcus sp. cluster3_bin.96]
MSKSSRCDLVLTRYLSAIGLICGTYAPVFAQTNVAPLDEGGTTEQLEKSWERLNNQVDAIDTLTGPAPAIESSDDLRSLEVPKLLIDVNAPASAELTEQDTQPDPLLLLPSAPDKPARILSLTLENAVTLAFRNNPSLGAQRDLIKAQAATIASESSRYWPTISVFANVDGFQSGTTTYNPYGNNTYGLGSLFNRKGQTPNFAFTNDGNQVSGASAGPFYVPSGGGLSAVMNGVSADAGLQDDYDIINFARTPRVQAAQARLTQQENLYADRLRVIQLEVSEAYYNLQRAEQLVQIRDAIVRTDLVVLEDTLDLKQAGLVPRVDLLRRSSLLAADEESLIQAMADRAVARRELWTVLNLSSEVIPSAQDPISLQPRWPLNLEKTVLAAYDDNPELTAILATQQALIRRQDEAAAQLLPRLSLFAAAGGLGSVEQTFNLAPIGGGCCGDTFLPLEQVSGYEWSVGLAFNWMIFDAGGTSNRVKALQLQEQATAEHYASTRNAIRLRLERAFLNHEASLAKLVSARRAVGASKEAFRDTQLRYQTGLSDEIDLSITQEQLVNALVRRLFATVDVNVTYARMLRELLPMPKNPNHPVLTQLTLSFP